MDSAFLCWGAHCVGGFFFLIVRELQFIFRVLVYFANSAFQQQFLLLEKLVLIFYILMF